MSDAPGNAAAPAQALQATDVWTRFCSHFSFHELGWLLSTFETVVEERNPGHDTVTHEGAAAIIGAFMVKKWPDTLVMPDFREEFLGEVFEGMPDDMDFECVVHALATYKRLHIEAEPFAAFPGEEVLEFKRVYKAHDPSGNGLRGGPLFAVLDSLGIHFSDEEDRRPFIESVARLDKDISGTIDFEELLQVLRSVDFHQEMCKRKREFDLVERSGLPLHEVEDWAAFFDTHDTECTGELTLSQLKGLLTDVGVTWDTNSTWQIMQWAEELDENQNGTIDFGEFVNIMSRMWETDFCSVRTLALQSFEHDEPVALLDHSGRYLLAQGSELRAVGTSISTEGTFALNSGPDLHITLRSSEQLYIMVRDNGRVDCSATSEASAARLSLQWQGDGKVVLQSGDAWPTTIVSSETGELTALLGEGSRGPRGSFELVRLNQQHNKKWTKMKQRAPLRPTTAEPVVATALPKGHFLRRASVMMSLDAVLDATLDANRDGMLGA